MPVSEERIIKLEGRVAALIEMLSGKERDRADAEKVKRFIDNYAVVSGVIENRGVENFITSLVEAKKRFDTLSGKLDGLLGSIDAESDRLVKSLGDGASGVALNIADMIMFQTSVSDGYKSMLEHLRDINITGKINEMEASLREAMGLISDLRSQREQINTILQRIADDETVIKDVQSVNDTQQQLIKNTENMIAEVEKEIENYGFYAEEFDKIYTTASNFVARFRELVSEIDRIATRDTKLESLMADVLSVSFESVEQFEALTTTLSQAIRNLGTDTAQKLEDMTMFINEFNAIGLALGDIKDKMSQATLKCKTVQAKFDNIQIGI